MNNATHLQPLEGASAASRGPLLNRLRRTLCRLRRFRFPRLFVRPQQTYARLADLYESWSSRREAAGDRAGAAYWAEHAQAMRDVMSLPPR